jgi:cephalosporin hydroxylase
MRDLEWRLVKRGWLARGDVERATALARPGREWIKRRAPWVKAWRDEVVFQVKRPYRWFRKVTVPLRLPALPDGRVWRSLVDNRLHIAMMRGAMAYRYRGMRCVRYPIDLAIYLMLFQELRPETVIEIGSKEGGSAALYGNWLEMFHIPGKVYSIDLEPPNPKYQPFNVFFLRGDENNLSGTGPFPGDRVWWGTLPHPWLVINDASHQYAAISRSMDFLNEYMVTGDMMVIEDGFLTELGEERQRQGGPGRAIAEFLRANKDWKIEPRYCDFYGRNVTANPNGYLVKL